MLVCYEGDLPSANMKKDLLRRFSWEDMGSDGRNSYLSHGDLVLMTVDRMHVHAENIDSAAEDFGVSVDDMVVLSKHSSASGKPTLTVHPIGNYRDAQLGGRERTLVKAMPHLMSATLRQMSVMATGTCYSVSYEVTHHGPYVDVPAMYIEIGSDETHWGDTVAAGILMDALLSAEEKNHSTVIGVGGGHYAPRFTELALLHCVDVGHMVPNYQIEGTPDDMVCEMISHAAEATGTEMVYVHRNSMKGPEQRRINALIDGLGLKRVSSDDFSKV